MFNVVYYGLLFIYEELLYKIILQLPIHFSSILFSLTIGLFVGFISSLIFKKLNYVIYNVTNLLICIYYGASLMIRKVFGIIINPGAFSMYKQVTTGVFMDTFVDIVASNVLIIIMVLLPFVIGLFLNKFLSDRRNINYILVVIVPFILFWIFSNSDVVNLLYNNKSDVDKLGVCSTAFMNGDVTIEVENNEELSLNEEVQEEIVHKPQIEDIDFEGLEENSDVVNGLNEYFKSQTPTYTNEYTGMLEGKNLIYIMAESFDGYFVSEELTPTLYKLIHEGLYFDNYYAPTNLSTIGGEFSLLTGLLPDLGVLNNQWNGNNNTSGHHNYYPYGLDNLFHELDYKVYAYHDYYYNFQNRDYYLSDLGFENYKACGNGLEERMECSIFPTSDDEMILSSVEDYINDDKFMVYYATVSGHGKWGFGYNAMAERNKDAVKDLKYSDTVKAYISANLELEKALTSLINKLEEKGKLDDTVIVLASDHHPYFMENEYVEEMAGKKLDQFSLYKNNLIIYNSQFEHKQIDKVCNTIDVLPTVLNLFGIKYDSRLLVGKDILSDNEGLVIFADQSFITDKGTYSSTKNKFESFDGSEVDEDYVAKYLKIVSNRYQVSKNIMVYDYYRYLFNGAPDKT